MSYSIVKSGNGVKLINSEDGAITYFPQPQVTLNPVPNASVAQTFTFTSGELNKSLPVKYIATIGGNPAAATPSDVLDQILALISGSTSIEAPALPLPTGAATAEKQDRGNLALDSLSASVGLRTDAAATDDTGSFTLIAFIKRALGNWTSLLARIPALSSGRTPVKPSLTGGGHIALTTNATGTNFTAFASQACLQLTIANNTGVDLEVQQGAETVYFPVFANTAYTFFGITNANQLSIRRVDISNTTVSVKARWES